MNPDVVLSEEQVQFVRGLVTEGHYASAQEVIDAALRLLRQDDDATLRAEIALAVQQADQGELTAFDPRATLQQVRNHRLRGQ